MIKIAKNSKRLIDALATISRMSKKRVGLHLKYQIITVRQLAALTKQPVYTIENMIRLGKLNVEFPFPHASKNGPKFITRDEKFDIYIRSFISKAKVNAGTKLR